LASKFDESVKSPLVFIR